MKNTRPKLKAGQCIPDSARLSRRTFLQTGLVATGSLALPNILPSYARAATGPGPVPPSERITIGLIGKGVMGNGHMRHLAYRDEVELVAVCDVDQTRRETGRDEISAINAEKEPRGTYRGCTAYNDYREVLARPDIDAVVIVTPDHWHALMAIDAAKAGKDIYCEKPVSMTIQEGRQIAETVKRYGRVFQTGTQYRSIPDVRRVCQFVRDGRLGRVKSVFTLYRSIRPQISGARFRSVADVVNADLMGSTFVPMDFALPAEPVPAGLDWDLWVGPAPWRDYNRLYHVNPAPGVVPWCFADAFGLTSSTLHFSHSADVLQWALGFEKSGPVEIFHPSNGTYPTLTCRYADGTLLHLLEDWEQAKTIYQAVPPTARLAGAFGAVFVGERGWLTSMSTGGRLEGEPESLFSEMGMARRGTFTNSNNHHANWLECIRTRKPPSTDEEIGHRSASLGHLLNIACWTGQSLRWDPTQESFVGNPEADRLRSRAMRAPWRA